MQQRAIIGSVLLAETDVAAWPQVFDRRGDTHFEACTGLPRAPYLVAVASDDEPPPLPPSVYISRDDVDTDLLSAIALAKQVHETKAKLDEIQAKADETQAKLDDTRTRLQDVTQRAERAERERVAAEQRFALLRGSLRTFLRGYLPLLRAHLFGQRP
jgi:hypothetical protein